MSTCDPSSSHLVVSSKKHNIFVKHNLALGIHVEKDLIIYAYQGGPPFDL